MNKRLSGVILLVIILLLGAWVLGFKEKEDQTVVLGATLPLSGDLAFLGEGYKKGMELALDDLGTTKYKYRLVFEDDKFDPKTGATTANKLLAVTKVNGIFSFGSPVGNVVSPLAEKHKVVHLNGIASDGTIAKGKYNFIHWTPPYEESRVLVLELQKRNLKKVGILATNQPGALALANQAKTDLEKAGILIVGSERFNPGSKDMRTQVNKVRAGTPDIYLIIATSPELEVLAKQIRELGIKTPLTSIESFEFTSEPELFEGMWYVNAADPTDNFVSKYKAKYGMQPTLGAANGYDVVRLFVQAVEQEGLNSERIQQFLSSVKAYSGAVGSVSADPEGIMVSEAVVRVITDGKPVTIK